MIPKPYLFVTVFETVNADNLLLLPHLYAEKAFLYSFMIKLLLILMVMRNKQQ